MSEEGDSSEQAVGNDDDLIEPNKAKHKIIRVLTVIAYTLSVSMAAILLSIYYVFMWDGHPTLARKDPSHGYSMAQRQQPPLSAAYTLSTSGTTMRSHAGNNSEPVFVLSERFDHSSELENAEEENTEENVLVDVPYEPTAIPVVEAKTEAPPPSTPDPDPDDENSNDDDYSNMNITKLTKRSPMFKKLILRSIMD